MPDAIRLSSNETSPRLPSRAPMKTSSLPCWGEHREVSGHIGPDGPSQFSKPKERGEVEGHRGRKRVTADKQRTPEFVTVKLGNASGFCEYDKPNPCVNHSAENHGGFAEMWWW